MKGINITLADENHHRLTEIKEALGKTNLSDTITEMIRRFPLVDSSKTKKAIFKERHNGA